jgi:type IV pilus assembly protein PilB
MYASRLRIGELLVSHRLITNEQLNEALRKQKLDRRPLGQILMDMNAISEERLLQACALQKGVAPWHLQHDPPNAEAVAVVPGSICRSYVLLPVAIKGNTLVVAMRSPGDIDAIDTLREVTKMRIEPVLASEERIQAAIDDIYVVTAPGRETLSRFVTEAMGELGPDTPTNNAGTVTDAEIRPVVGLVNQIIAEAINLRASDIHVEPRRDRIEIRYRLDGQLQKVHEIPHRLQQAFVARVKIMAQMDIVEYRVPQDGHIEVATEGRTVDLRVSTVPSIYGQRIVLRILDKSATLRNLPELGLSEHNMGLFMDIVQKPYGLILVTGPTGSGKTTTLYAALNKLKAGAINIMTCEDPVEYAIDGINQSNVNEKVGLTFAKQLRAVLRQDPDIVLVGEIRDQETAETAIRAALTGHLVLSTLHCNDAPSALPRLTDMQVEPFLLSTALIGVTAQRLVRILCQHCKEAYAPTDEELRAFGPEFGRVDQLWRPIGCPKCNHSGYSGRMGIHEVMPVGRDVQSGIAACESLESIRRSATLFGYKPMQLDVCQRLIDGKTSMVEAKRLIYFDNQVIEAQTQTPHLELSSYRKAA